MIKDRFFLRFQSNLDGAVRMAVLRQWSNGHVKIICNLKVTHEG